MSINVLSLFDGMSCGQIALRNAGVKVDKYYASEIDKHAVSVTKHNNPNTIHLGDVTKWREWDIDWPSIKLLIGGSPCQGFSSAGKRLAFDDPRSALFFIYVDILNHIRSVNPNVKFLLENVRMKTEHIDVISRHLGVDPIFIDSGDISPCARPRFYWCNWLVSQPNKVDISFGDVIDYLSTENTMSDAWHSWWEKNKDFQIKKSYSKIVHPGQQGITMTARQYASWNGNFIPTPDGKLRKPTKIELAKLVGAPSDYFSSASQRQAELMTGNGWTVDVIAHIFSHI